MPHDVFISYATPDAAVAERVCHLLESRQLACWMAPRDIPPGHEWAASVVEAIQKAKALVLVFSEHANASAAIRRELDRAFSFGLPVFPLRIQKVEPSGGVALYIATVQWIDALTPPIDAQIGLLADGIRAMLGPTQGRGGDAGVVDQAPTAAERPNAAARLAETGARTPPAGTDPPTSATRVSRTGAGSEPNAAERGQAADGEVPVALPPRTTSAARPPRRRWAALAIAATLIAVAALAVIGLKFLGNGSSEETEDPAVAESQPAVGHGKSLPDESGRAVTSPSTKATEPPEEPLSARSGGKQPPSQKVPSRLAIAPDAEPDLPQEFRKLLPLHERLAEPAVDQTYSAYLDSEPTTPSGKKWKVYVQPLGEFQLAERKIIDLTAKYLGILCDLPVETLADLPLDDIPDSARREGAQSRQQLSASHLLYELLLPRKPEDAAIYVAFTTADLWPGKGAHDDWNYCFGLATYHDRVGVWSVSRYGDPGESATSFRTCLCRTLKISAGLNGSMFSLKTCGTYQCDMNQTMSVTQLDRIPLWFCPRCHAKLCWATKVDPQKQLARLTAFCQDQDLMVEREFFAASLRTMRDGSQ